MILHTVNKSPFNNGSFAECLAYCSAHSSVLLIEDGVYAAQRGTAYSEVIAARDDIHFYVLAADIAARGIQHQLCNAVSVVDDAGFVELAATHDTVQSWY